MSNQMNELDTYKRIVYLDALRILAVMGTLMIHVSCMNWADVSYDSPEWNVMNLLNATSRFSVPVFLMISGALTLNKRYSYKSSVYKILHRIINIILWGFIYCLWSKNINPNFGLTDWISCLISGYEHMWYLWLTIGIIVLLPVFRVVAADKYVLWYIICVLFVTTCFIPTIFQLFNYLHCTNEYLNTVFSSLNNNYMNMGLNSFSCYIMYFLLGFYINNKRWDFSRNKSCLFWGGVCF